MERIISVSLFFLSIRLVCDYEWKIPTDTRLHIKETTSGSNFLHQLWSKAWSTVQKHIKETLHDMTHYHVRAYQHRSPFISPSVLANRSCRHRTYMPIATRPHHLQGWSPSSLACRLAPYLRPASRHGALTNEADRCSRSW
jgi:hypothetical protein